jgi:hypothetical protein
MPEGLQTLFTSIYNRIIPKLVIPNLNVQVNNETSSHPEITLTSESNEFYVCLSLFTETNEEDINTYRWEYLDCVTGALAKSDLTYEATDEEVIEFFNHTVENDDSVMDLPE